MSTRPTTGVREVLESIEPIHPQPVQQQSAASSGGQPAKARDSEKALAIRAGIGALDAALKAPELHTKAAAAVAALRDDLASGKRMVFCDDIDELAVALAKDEGTAPETAKEKLIANKARGFTAETTGDIYFLRCEELPHDMVHETVHVASAPGGTTVIKTEFGDPLNEGFTEWFTRQYCLKLKVRIAQAYVDEVAFVNKLQQVLGLGMIFNAYMKNGGMGPILAALSARWKARSAQFASDESLRGFAAPDDDAERVQALAARLKNGAFLGAGKPFWGALLA